MPKSLCVSERYGEMVWRYAKLYCLGWIFCVESGGKLPGNRRYIYVFMIRQQSEISHLRLFAL